MVEINNVSSKKNNGWSSPLKVWNDPFYYALRLPSLWSLLLSGFLFLALVSVAMVVIWFMVKAATLGSFPSIEGQPVKMFIGSAAVAVYILLAGVIHRRMTMPAMRGKSVVFSNFITLVDAAFTFSIVDTHRTQMIATKLLIELILVDDSGVVEARRVDLGSPGIIAILTPMSVPILDLLPKLQVSNDCKICGQSDFSLRGYSLHMSFRHGIEVQETGHSIPRVMEEIQAVEKVRVVLTGIDEMSGKPGIAVKEYLRSDFKLDQSEEQIYDVHEDKDLSDSLSGTFTTIASLKNYVSIDFKSLK